MTRYGMGLVLSFFVAIALFTIMRALIQMDTTGDKDGAKNRTFELVEVREEQEVQTTRRKPPPPPPPQQPPPSAPKVSLDRANVGMDISVGDVKVSASVNLSGAGGFTSDGEYLPIVKVQPQYPRRALERGVEGYVLLEYTVTASGTVKDPVVIEASPPGMFDKEAIASALKYKYKPKVVNGEAIEVPGVRTRISFELDQGRR